MRTSCQLAFLLAMLYGSGGCVRTSHPAAIPAGSVLIYLPRLVCSDSDRIGTSLEAEVHEYDPLGKDDAYPPGSLATIVLDGIDERGAGEMRFRITAVRANGQSYRVRRGSAVTEVERVSRPVPGHKVTAICYAKGQMLPGSIDEL